MVKYGLIITWQKDCSVSAKKESDHVWQTNKSHITENINLKTSNLANQMIFVLFVYSKQSLINTKSYSLTFLKI